MSIDNVLNAQELQQVQFSQSLQRDPGQYQAYVKGKVQTLMDETLNTKRSAFQKAHIDAGRYMDMDHNAQLYKTRSDDVGKLQDAIEKSNNLYLQNIEKDKNLSRRQVEINEYSYNNKLETLFFLQLLLMTVLLLTLVAYLHKSAIVGNTVAGILSIFVLLIIVGVGIYRWNYTNSTRDGRFWSRRYFKEEEDGAGQSNAGHCDAQGNYVFDLKKLVPDVLDQSARTFADRLERVNNELIDQAAVYQTTGTLPLVSKCAQTTTS
jgi:hypothetical protein